MKLTRETEAFFKDCAGWRLTGAGYRELQGKLFYLKEEYSKVFSGVRILRKGLFLGEMKKGRFEPSQPLAAALYPEEYDKYISFELEDERTIRYLKCETLNADVETEGIHLIGTGRFPLGWGKVKKGRIKNKYASSWRWM